MARTMKDSGDYTLGLVPEQWDIIKVCYLCDDIFSGASPEYSITENNNLTIGQKNNQKKGIDLNGIKYSTDYFFNTRSEKEFLKYGDTLLNSLGGGSVGRIGFYNILNKKIITDGHIIIFRPSQKINSKYLYYSLWIKQKYLEDSSVGSTNQAFLNVSDVYKLLIAIPKTFNEQQQIANFLDKKCQQIDSVLVKTRESIEEYKKLKNAVITQAVTKGIRPNRKMKDSGIEWIGEIPDDWGITKLTHCAKVKPGIALGKIYPQTATLLNYPYLRVANVQDGFVDISEITELLLPEQEANKYLLEKYDILMTEGGDRDKLGRGCVWKGEIEPCLHQNHVFALKTNEKILNHFFMAYLTSSKYARTYFDVTALKTTNLACTTSSKILAFLVVLPSITEQQEIAGYLDKKCSEIDTLITKKEQLITELETYKKSLIYEYVTGKKEVK